ncbi:hypothetical protein ACET3Z_012579 [Daucus carota]
MITVLELFANISHTIRVRICRENGKRVGYTVKDSDSEADAYNGMGYLYVKGYGAEKKNFTKIIEKELQGEE